MICIRAWATTTTGPFTPRNQRSLLWCPPIHFPGDRALNFASVPVCSLLNVTGCLGDPPGRSTSTSPSRLLSCSGMYSAVSLASPKQILYAPTPCPPPNDGPSQYTFPHPCLWHRCSMVPIICAGGGMLRLVSPRRRPPWVRGYTLPTDRNAANNSGRRTFDEDAAAALAQNHRCHALLGGVEGPLLLGVAAVRSSGALVVPVQPRNDELQ